MTVADYIINFLVQRGSDTAFCLTGWGAMGLDDAMVRRMKVVCVRNEAAAPVMAKAWAKLKQKPGVVIVTAGPGAANVVGGLAELWVDSVPCVILSGQVPSGDIAEYCRTFGTAGIDILPIVRPLTKWATRISVDDLNNLDEILLLAYDGSMEDRKGPVWIDVPLDIQTMEVPEQLPVNPHLLNPQISKDMQQSLQWTANDIAKALQQSQRPFVMIGQGVNRSQMPELLHWLETQHIPFGVSRLAIDYVPHAHHLHMGNIGIKGQPYSAKLLESCDLLISLGCRLATTVLIQRPEKIIMVDRDVAECDRVNPTEAHYLDVNQVISLLSPNRMPQHDQWLTQCQVWRHEEKPWKTLLRAPTAPLDLYYFMDRLDQCANESHIACTDAGSNYYCGGQMFQFAGGYRELTSGSFAAMGISLPLAIGAAIAEPEKTILAVTGDGSLELNIQELKTMAFYNLNIKLFIINNGGYLSMRNWQDKHFEGRRIETETQNTFDFDKLATAFDLQCECLGAIPQTEEELMTRLRAICARPGPELIEVVCSPTQQIFSVTP